MTELHYQSAALRLGTDREEAALVFAGRELLAVLVFLEPARYRNDPDIAGRWAVEIGFGGCAVGTKTVLFDSLEEGLAWVAERHNRG